MIVLIILLAMASLFFSLSVMRSTAKRKNEKRRDFKIRRNDDDDE